jgi:type I restriction enzyme S subunit
MKQKEKSSLKQLVPSLRFPEFVDAGDWEEVGGDSLFILIVNKNHDSNLPILAISQEYGAIPRNLIDYHISVTDKSIESYKVVEPGDFIISLRSFQGGIEYSEYHGICSPAYIILRKKTELSNHFYRHYFKTANYIRDLNRNIEGIRDGKMVSYKQFSDIKIPFPSLPEQQKIADCLSSLDDLIQLETKKWESLKSYKKGLLQKLFPAEGETLPRLRFPEFEGAGDWEEVGGDFLFDPITNKNHDSSLPILAITQEHGAIPRHLIDYQISVTEKSIESYKVVEPGDFIISLRSFQGGIEYSNYLGICSPAYIILRKNRDLSNHFYRYYFKTTKYIQDLNKNLEGIRDGKMVSFKQFSEIKIPLPTLSEQLKIADCLSLVDGLIQEQSERVEGLKSHKKGLLQGLFPVMGE